jgi:hypothetical protein
VPNPSLAPEHQQGAEGGIELYWGRRFALVMTRYNQVVDGLIARPDVDSVRSLVPNPRFSSSVLDADGYGFYGQGKPLNIGSIRNQGWELQGTVTTGPLSTKGTYSWTKSRVIGVNAAYRNLLSGTQYQPGTSFSYLPEHTWALSVTYARAGTSVGLNLTGTGMLRNFINQQYMEGLNTSIRLPANRLRMDQPSTYAYLNAGYFLADLIATHQLAAHVEGLVQIQNVGDQYHSDYGASYATLGRQTRAGVRLRL